jgi:hypothetical protein
MADHLEPWEQPGALRRDYLAHRGPWLVVLGVAALLCAIALPPVGLALGILTWRLAQSDLARMNAGQMDPAGRPTTSDAACWGWRVWLSPASSCSSASMWCSSWG